MVSQSAAKIACGLDKHLYFNCLALFKNSIRMVSLMHLLEPPEENSMLRITTEKKRGKVTLNVEGRIAGPWVPALEQCWRELHTGSPKEKFSVNLCGVSFIDAAGKVLLKEIHRQGGRLVAEGCLNQAVIGEIIGDKREGKKANGSERRKGSHIIFYGVLFSLLVSAGATQAQDASKKGGLPENPANQILRLTLDQAVGLALKQNPTAQIAVLPAEHSGWVWSTHPRDTTARRTVPSFHCGDELWDTDF